MIPWPIALLAAWHTALATWFAADAWRALHAGPSAAAWAGVWMIWCAMIVVGLAYLKPWARTMAFVTALGLMALSLFAALLAIAQSTPEPRSSLASTAFATFQLVIARYVTRPHVKRWFPAQASQTS